MYICINLYLYFTEIKETSLNIIAVEYGTSDSDAEDEEIRTDKSEDKENDEKSKNKETDDKSEDKEKKSKDLCVEQKENSIEHDLSYRNVVQVSSSEDSDSEDDSEDSDSSTDTNSTSSDESESDVPNNNKYDDFLLFSRQIKNYIKLISQKLKLPCTRTHIHTYIYIVYIKASS